MSATADRSSIRAQFDSLILTEGWGTISTIIRPTKTINTQGQFDETDVTLTTTELLWIQPATGNSEINQSQLNDKTTHLAFQQYSGLLLKAKDRVTQGGLQYDVVNHFVYESHRLSELQLVIKQ